MIVTWVQFLSNADAYLSPPFNFQLNFERVSSHDHLILTASISTAAIVPVSAVGACSSLACTSRFEISPIRAWSDCAKKRSFLDMSRGCVGPLHVQSPEAFESPRRILGGLPQQAARFA